MSESTPATVTDSQRRWRWARRSMIAGGVALALAVPAAWVAHGQTRHHGMSFMRGGQVDLETAQEWLAVFVRQTLRKLEATPDQHARIQGIAERALADLYPLRERQREARVTALTLLSAERIDPQGAETLRAQQIALHEQASKRIMQAVLEAAEVLTPPQRDQLAKEIAARRWRHG
jgi:periplasmic protein CpxP/Spy